MMFNCRQFERGEDAMKLLKVVVGLLVVMAMSDAAVAQQYYGLRIDADNVAFALDVSGSMEDKSEGVGSSAPMTVLLDGVQNEAQRRIGGRLGGAIAGRLRSETTKLGAARRELIRALDGLEADTRFTIITFGGDGAGHWPLGVRTAGGAGRRVAQGYVAQLSAEGGTPLLSALQQAYAVEGVEVIFLVSDGKPTDAAAARILGMLPQLDRSRNIVVNTVGIGPDQDQELLCELARRTGGFYVREGQVVCHAGVCDDPETRAFFNPHPNANYHQYRTQTTICRMGQPGCTREAVYRAMISELRFVAPTESTAPVRHCGGVVLVNNNPIRIVLDHASYAAANYTRVGHDFHPGRIVRTIEEVQGQIVVRTFGEGNGDKRAANEHLLNHIWPGIVDPRLRRRFELP
jgi:hypothetical protein